MGCARALSGRTRTARRARALASGNHILGSLETDSDSAISSARLWSIIRVAIDLTPDVLATFGLRTEKALALLFTTGGRLDYRVPVVGQIHDNCAARLQCT
jgi:hypothetical protein